MPPTQVVFYQELDGRAPVLEWMRELRRWDPEAFARCRAVVERLHALGHELRRPASDALRDGIRELRARRGRVHYRILYFFHGGRAVLAHGLTKEGAISARDIERAVNRKRAFEAAPDQHTYEE
jgi:phage-related protein